jgi:hypothetical protein
MNGGWVSDAHDHFAFLVGVLWRLACLCARRYWCRLYSMDYVPQGQWMGPMNDLQVLIEQMVSDISGQAVRLKGLRLRQFLGWLGAHSSKVKVGTESDELVGKKIVLDVSMDWNENFEVHLKTNLKVWFESLPMQGLLWEYHLILDEIAWWRDLDARRLMMILRSEEKK